MSGSCCKWSREVTGAAGQSGALIQLLSGKDERIEVRIVAPLRGNRGEAPGGAVSGADFVWGEKRHLEKEGYVWSGV